MQFRHHGIQLYTSGVMSHTHASHLSNRIATWGKLFMTLLSMNEMTTFRWSFAEDVENYQQAGYQAISVWRQKLSEWDEDEAIDLLAGSDLIVSNLQWAGGFTGSDGRGLAESIDDAMGALRLAAALDARCLTVYPGGRNNHTFRHAARLLRTAIDELLPLAENLEVPLAIEPVQPACAAEWSFLTDLESVAELIREYGSPCLKLAYDTYHFPLTGQRQHELAELTPHLAIVHLGDRRVPPTVEQERCPLGYGRLPLGEIVATLQDAGYTGPFDVKLPGTQLAACDYWKLLEQSQLAFQELAQTPAVR